MIVSESAIKWILCFRSKTFEHAQDVLICNNIKETHLSDVIMKISRPTTNNYKNFSVEEYDILEDPLHVL
ncbi:putative LRR containing protein [Trachipleistophora hominis]|uniref:Putative LRR containing protein n=1 Tax=Trachipleistophora hominis TaxID=72359 RepID=L7JWX2_TRAHO|nr:putative LRR containing protein [Trachipleistophora hominis]